MHKLLLGSTAAVLLFGVAACEGVNERNVLRDAGIGAAAGAVIGGVAGGNPLEGAAVGGAIGGGYGIYREKTD
jgi:osmotically inducible lipoprotein OsmB